MRLGLVGRRTLKIDMPLQAENTEMMVYSMKTICLLRGLYIAPQGSSTREEAASPSGMGGDGGSVYIYEINVLT